MRSTGILASLWRRRFVVALGVVAAVAAGLLASKVQGDSGVATTRVLVDTPRSLVAAAKSRGDETIVTRAVLLGSLLAADRVEDDIARRAGVSPQELAVVGPNFNQPAVATPLSRQAIEVATPREPRIVTVTLDDPQVPVVSIAATAADPEAAAKLAGSTTATLRSLVDHPGQADGSGVRIEQLGAVDAKRVSTRGTRLKSLIAGLGVFVLWCWAVVLFDRLSRRRARRVATNGRPASPTDSTRAAAVHAYGHRANGASRQTRTESR